MFLNELNDKEKKNFLELAYHAMTVDDNIDHRENEIFQNFRAELRLSETEYQIANKQVKAIITEFQASKKRVKKIVLFELWGIILADEAYSQAERELIGELAAAWNLKQFEVTKAKRWVQDFNEMLGEAYRFLDN